MNEVVVNSLPDGFAVDVIKRHKDGSIAGAIPLVEGIKTVEEADTWARQYAADHNLTFHEEEQS